VCIELDESGTIYSVQRNVSAPNNNMLSPADWTLRSRLPVSAAKDVILGANALKPIGSNLAVNHVLRMSTVDVEGMF